VEFEELPQPIINAPSRIGQAKDSHNAIVRKMSFSFVRDYNQAWWLACQARQVYTGARKQRANGWQQPGDSTQIPSPRETIAGSNVTA